MKKHISQSLIVLLCAAARMTAGPKGDLLQRAPASSQARVNPLEPTNDNRRAGNKLFLQECAACHGREAMGKGKAPPLATPMVRKANPGTLFWILRNGALCHGMPSFAHLPEAERWQIITFLKTP
ncbi:MAG: cytochrome c [Bryobacteraceae bacterium]